jgi:hypothetical protein
MMLVNADTRDVTAALQDATRDFAAFYENHAYVAYNVALRVTCERALAMAVAERAFLEQAAGPHDGDALTAAVVSYALAEARPRPRPGGAGGADEEAMLEATARSLDARERAMLALTALTGDEPGAIASLLSLTGGGAEQLVESSYEKLAAARADTLAETYAAYEQWLWAAPPSALWEGLYPKFYRAAERALQPPVEADAELTQKLPRQRRPKRRRRGLSGMKFALALLLPALVVGGALAWGRMHEDTSPSTHAPSTAHASPAQTDFADTGDGSGSDMLPAVTPGSDSGDATAAAPASKKRKPLTARELDQLRRNELRALELYSRRETDRRLTQAQREYASTKVGLLRELAQRRIEADRRERALARAERRAARRERELARRQEEAGKNGQTMRLVTDDGSPDTTDNANSKDTSPPPSDGAPKDSTEAQQECLYDSDSGTYICPK